MKRLYTIAIPLFLFAAVCACKKASGPANGNSVQPNNNLDSLVSMSAVVNHQYWQTDSAFGYLVKTSSNDSGATSLLINAIQGSGSTAQTINLYITNYTGLGTYPINAPYTTATYYMGTTRHFATSGQVTIQSNINYSLIGTFSFVADTITVDSGVFNVAMP